MTGGQRHKTCREGGGEEQGEGEWGGERQGEGIGEFCKKEHYLIWAKDRFYVLLTILSLGTFMHLTTCQRKGHIGKYFIISLLLFICNKY